jgi:hypothetical protein
MAPEVVTDGG